VREFFIDNLLVRIHFIIVMIRWTGLASWDFELSGVVPWATALQVSARGARLATGAISSASFLL